MSYDDTRRQRRVGVSDLAVSAEAHVELSVCSGSLKPGGELEGQAISPVVNGNFRGVLIIAYFLEEGVKDLRVVEDPG